MVIKNYANRSKKKNASQAEKGRKRAKDAVRDEKGKFRTGKKEELQEAETQETASREPSQKSSREPSRKSSREPSRKSSLYVVDVDVDLFPGIGPGKNETGIAERRSRPIEMRVDEALEDTHWLSLLVGVSELPLDSKKLEVAKYLKERIILTGKEGDIRSADQVKAYLRNLTRKGSDTYREIQKKLTGATAEGNEQNERNDRTEETNGKVTLIRVGYEDVNPVTGERSYYGMKIPQNAPPRPGRNAVWNERGWE